MDEFPVVIILTSNKNQSEWEFTPKFMDIFQYCVEIALSNDVIKNWFLVESKKFVNIMIWQLTVWMKKVLLNYLC